MYFAIANYYFFSVYYISCSYFYFLFLIYLLGVFFTFPLVVTRGHSWSLVLIRSYSWSLVVTRGQSWSPHISWSEVCTLECSRPVKQRKLVFFAVWQKGLYVSMARKKTFTWEELSCLNLEKNAHVAVRGKVMYWSDSSCSSDIQETDFLFCMSRFMMWASSLHGTLAVKMFFWWPLDVM